jgi:hypothetical protein
MAKDRYPSGLDLATRSDDILLRFDFEEFPPQSNERKSHISLSEMTRHSMSTHNFMQSTIGSQPIYPPKYG